MKIHDWLALPGRKFDQAAPIPGLSPCLVDGQAFFAKVPNTGGRPNLGVLDPNEAKAWALKGAIGAPIVPDIENRHFLGKAPRDLRTDIRFVDPKDGHATTAADVREDAAYLIQAVRMVKAAARGPVGLYDTLPSGFDVYNLVLCNDADGLAWASGSNDLLASTGLLALLDMVCPSLYQPYTTGDHPKVWARAAAWTRGECRRLAPTKPAIPFLTPVCRSTGELLPIDQWRSQLQTVATLAFDGAILWAGGLEKTTWAAAAEHVAAAQWFAGYVPPRYDTADASSLKPLGR